jgi:starch synthase (maltosyl-transferring)
MTPTSTSDSALLACGRLRARIEAIHPEIDGGRFPAKRELGDVLVVQVDLVADGHDILAGAAHFRHEGATEPRSVPLTPLVNDRWQGSTSLEKLGTMLFSITAWVDEFATWRRGFERKIEAGQDVAVDILSGAALLEAAAARAAGPEKAHLEGVASSLQDKAGTLDEKCRLALDPALVPVVSRLPDPEKVTCLGREVPVTVDPVRARFSAWYEMFPRSCGKGGKHGTFRDAEEWLPYVAGMGFDVLYLPPIHPIGRSHRKGRNNSTTCEKGDPGSCWAIGAREGGHKDVHPELGTLDDFRHFVEKAREHGLAVALDIALQASPDHPYVKEHPEWFRARPDGTIQYAENPPKKYQDIYPFDFEGEAWQSLWQELLSIFLFWAEQGVRVFRVDNPHTKPIAFWEWCLTRVKKTHPDAIFLAEAFTRPKLMYALAKVGFSQSYTYFTWRTTRSELTTYLTEVTRGEVAEVFRPNLWPNTPDILPEHLQFGGSGAFASRLVLAATLSSSYGVYGPAYELMEHEARPGSEEYIDNEKYELKTWDVDRPDSLQELMRRVNRIRKENPALHHNRTLVFHKTDNPSLLCYSKTSSTRDNAVLVVVNLDPHHPQRGAIELDLAALGVPDDSPFQVHDQIGDARFLWRGSRCTVELDPAVMPAHVFRVLRRVRREQDFEYFL